MSWACGLRSIGYSFCFNFSSLISSIANCGVKDEVAHVSKTSFSGSKLLLLHFLHAVFGLSTKGSTGRFFSSKSLIIDFLASFIAIPPYFPVFLSSLPSLVKEIFNGSLWLYHHSISKISPKVQHITIPVPLFWSTFASSIIGTS